VDRRVDLAIALAIASFAVFVLVVAQGIRSTGQVVDPLGPRAIPFAIGLILLVGAGAVVARRLLTWRSATGTLIESDGEPDEPGIPASAKQAAGVALLSFLFIALLPMVGYPLLATGYIAGGLLVMRTRSVPLLVWLSLGFSVVTYAIFALVLGVDLPAGPLTELLRSLGVVR
jgi:putative tricarboxylic transport membrane protein